MIWGTIRKSHVILQELLKTVRQKENEISWKKRTKGMKINGEIENRNITVNHWGSPNYRKNAIIYLSRI